MAIKSRSPIMDWFRNKKSTLVYASAILGWALFLGPQALQHAESVKEFGVQQWQKLQQWQGHGQVEDAAAPICQNPGYTTRIVSYDPFIMHIENFVSAEERKYLLELGTPLLQRSHVMLDNGTSQLDQQRTSNTAFLGRNDPIVECILERAGQLQGFFSADAIEDLQLTAYGQGQEYRPHYDWFVEHMVPAMGNQNRGSTFFVTMDADCENCGTQFPRVTIDWRYKDQRWCEFVDCDSLHALTVKARPGSAVFWQNLDAQGYGNPKTMHAGLPVPEGKKIGMNIWTRVAPAWAVGELAASSSVKWRGV